MNYPDLRLPSPVRLLADPVFEDAGVTVYLKRDDLIHPEISGNKWRKLKYNVLRAIRQQSDTLVTFGGAYSNHLFALASFGQMAGIRTVGIVRGEELSPSSSPTLLHCAARGMELHFITRSEYRLKESGGYFRSLIKKMPGSFVIPEGGTNQLALEGVGEIADESEQAGIVPDYYVVPSGTGGTAAGLLQKGKNVVAVAVLKNAGFLEADIRKWIDPSPPSGTLNLRLDYHFGGYGKYSRELLDFIEGFESRHHIALEQVYTGKMFYGLYDLIKRDYFAKGTVLMAVHTGGLQGKLQPKSS